MSRPLTRHAAKRAGIVMAPVVMQVSRAWSNLSVVGLGRCSIVFSQCSHTTPLLA
jgi:hypothetical protein